MGVDWAWMAPCPGVPRERLEQLIAREADEAMARGRTWYDDFEHLGPPPPVPEGDEWAAHVELCGALDVDWDQCRRVSFIGHCPLLPVEWRRAAYRSFLPDQLEAATRQWSAHIDHVRAAGPRGHAYAWYRYERDQDLARAWPELLGRTGRLVANASRIARPPGLLDLCDRVHALGTRPLADLTTWTPPLWQHDGRQVPAWPDTCEAALALIDEWNRTADRPVDFPRYMTSYQEYVERSADNEWLQDGLGWLWEAVGNGRGLYLWH